MKLDRTEMPSQDMKGGR